MNNEREQQIAILAQRAQQDGDDWRVKIARGDSPGGRIEQLATFDGATVEQIANADTWIPPLMGGTGNVGVYYLYVQHAKDRAVGRTSALLQLPGISGAPTPSAQIPWTRIEAPGWIGPRILVYPNPADLGTRPGAPVSASPVPPTGAGAGSPFFSSVPPGTPEALAAELRAEQRKLDEARQRAELEAIKRANEEAQRRSDAHMAEMREMVKSLVAIAQRPQTDLVELIAKGAAVLAPILTPLLAGRGATEQARVAAEERRWEREEARRIEERKREEDRAAESAKERNAMMERIANQGAEQSKAQAALSEAHATSMRTMIQTVTSLMELGIGRPAQEENPWAEMGKAFAAAFGERMAMGAGNVTPPALPLRSSGPFGTPPAASAPPATPAQPNAADTTGNAVSLFEALMGRIAERDPDLSGLADSIIEAVKSDSETQQALSSSGGNVIGLLRSVLGDEWANDAENQKYATSLLVVLGPKAQAAGILAPAPVAHA